MYGLVLVNCVSRGVGWLEGFSLKVGPTKDQTLRSFLYIQWPTKDIPEQRWTDSLMNYLIWYHLGPVSTRRIDRDREEHK